LAGEGGYAYQLLTATHDRSWAHMVYDVGTTISLEAWDNKYKPNQDWNHAWGAAPANIIPRGLFGIQPIKPGWAEARIKPQPGGLEKGAIRIPTVRGDVSVRFQKRNDSFFSMDVAIPGNMAAEIYIPAGNAGYDEIIFDGKRVTAESKDGFYLLGRAGSGEHTVWAK
jgi:hypothetical protein